MPRPRSRVRKLAQLAPHSRLLRGALAVVDGLRRPLTWYGVDHPRLHALLSTYLVLDERRGARAEDDLPSTSVFGGGLLLTCLFNLGLGIVAGLALMLPDPVLGLGLQQLVLGVFTVLILVSDYSSVVLDETDVALLSPLPVPDRTFLAARLVHVGVYLTLVVGSLALPGLCIGAFVRSTAMFVPVFCLSSLLTTVLAVACSFGLSVVAIRMFDMERFRNVLLYVQIGTNVLCFGGMQLFPRWFGAVDVARVLEENRWIAFLVPPFHQGGLLALAEGAWTPVHLALAGLAVLVPLVALSGVLMLGSRGFLVGLSRSVVARRRRGAALFPRSALRDRLLTDPQMRAGYDFFVALSARERNYRMRTYPVVAMVLVMGALGGSGPRGGEPGLVCGSIYMAAILAPVFLIQCRFSENFEARWLFTLAPIERPERILLGALRALALRTLLPILLLTVVLVLVLGGPGLAADAAFATAVAALLAGQVTRALGRRLPFTEKASKRGAQGSAGVTLLATTAVGIAVGLHLLLRLWPPVLHGATALLGLLALWTWWSLLRSAPRLARGAWPLPQ